VKFNNKEKKPDSIFNVFFFARMSEAGSSQEPVQKKRKRERDPNQLKMNTANSGLNWWLVKVPKYLGEKWLSSPTSEVGKIEIRRDKGRTEVNFKVRQKLFAQ
jgi:hypothetical protein